MQSYMIPFSAGVIILYCCSSLLVPQVLIWGGICSLFFLKGKRLVVTLFFLIGLLFSYYAVTNQIDRILPKSKVGELAAFRAYFCSLPKEYERFIQADMCVIESKASDLRAKKIRLSWSKKLSPDMPLGVMDVTAILKQPKATHNFIGFSYEKYLFYRGIQARGKAMTFQSVEDGHDLVSSFWLSLRLKLIAWRYQFVSYVDSLLEDSNHHGVMKALITGDTSRLSGRDALILKDTGTQHLIAISGLHVGLVMLVLVRMFPRSSSMYPILISLTFCYTVMVGFSESAQRALVMASIALILMSGRVLASRCGVFFLALCIVLLIEPLAPLNSGFWYSFVAVAVILLFSNVLSGRRSASTGLMKELAFIQLTLSFGLLIVNSCFGSASGLSSLFANLFAVPWVTLLLLPALLMTTLISMLTEVIGAEGVFDLSQNLFGVIDKLTQMMMEFLASLSLIEYQFNYLSEMGIGICFVVIFYSLTLFRLAWHYFGLFVGVLLLFMLMPLLKDNAREFIVFDAGQGLATAMIWDQRYWLYDTGIAMGGYSLVDSAIVPYLKQSGLYHKESGLIISHGDADHAGGLDRLLRLTDPHTIWMGEPDRLGWKDDFKCIKGSKWKHDSGEISVLYPFELSESEEQKLHKIVRHHRRSFLADQALMSSNNRSCVIRFELDGKVFLLMGDLEGFAEKQLVAKFKDNLKADVLIAGHHGSNNATRLTLLKYVRPEYVVISSGYRNSFNHPHDDVIRRSELLGAKVINTSKTGAIRFLVDDGELRVEYARKERRAPWFFDYE